MRDKLRRLRFHVYGCTHGQVPMSRVQWAVSVMESRTFGGAIDPMVRTRAMAGMVGERA